MNSGNTAGTAAVIGARGLIGSRVIELLIESGWQVRALVREEGWRSELSMEVVQGDLTNRSDLERLVEGVDAVFSCAGELHDPLKMDAVNKEAPALLAGIARDAGVQFFCHISSAGVVGPVRDEWIDESTPCRPDSHYEKSKWQGELALQTLNAGQMRICQLRPTNVFDVSSPGILRLASRSLLEVMPYLFFKGSECAHLIHAQEVAAAAFYLCQNESCHGIYFIGYDEDARNTVKSVIHLARGKMGKSSLSALSLPVAIPYYLRSLIRGQSLHGGSRFSSAKLLRSGYRFRYSLDEAIGTACHNDASVRA